MLNTIIKSFDIWTRSQTIKSNGRTASVDNQRLLGIDKLRELILELAVRGKLVPQDEKDEPASELLKSIIDKKNKLRKEGLLKGEENYSEVSEGEKSYDIPKSWVWTRLGSISIINPRNVADENLPVSFVPMPCISTSHKGIHTFEEGIWGNLKKGFTHFAEGDIGLAKITPCFENSKAVIFSNLINGIGAGTTELHVARPIEKTLVPRYVLLYLKSPGFLKVGESKMTGTAGQKRLPKSYFAENPFPLPPLAEQHRIVAKVDELMALCDQLEQQQTENNATHHQLVELLLQNLTEASGPEAFATAWQRIATNFDTLFTTEYSIYQFRQTILQLAVMGKLVPQDPQDEPASELLKKIAKEKERLVKKGKIRPQKLPKLDKQEELSLPVGWAYSYFGNLINLISGQHLNPNEYSEKCEPGMISYLTGPAEFGDKYPNPTRYTFQKRAIAQKGDILITCKGSGVGKLNESDGEIAISRQLMSIQPILGNIPFTKLLAESLNARFREKIVGIAIPGISREDVLEVIIQLPPIAEQHRIVAKVDELFALCDVLKERIKEAQQTQGMLAEGVVERVLG